MAMKKLSQSKQYGNEAIKPEQTVKQYISKMINEI
jgi:hypothetical protein